MDERERRERALEQVKSLGLKFPANWKFNRDEANMRSDDTDISVAPSPETSSLRLHS